MICRYSAYAEKLMIAFIIFYRRNSKICRRASRFSRTATNHPVSETFSLERMIGPAVPIIHSQPLLSQPLDRLGECHIELAHVGG